MLGLDVGGNQVKVALPGNRLVFPSSLIYGGNLNNNNARFAEYHGEIWQITDSPTKPQTIAEFARLAILTIADLVATGACQQTISHLTLAVPIDLFAQKTIWTEWLQGPHQFRFLNKKDETQVCVTIGECILLPQGYGAFFSHALDSEGAKIEQRLCSTIIIDCGANALSIAGTTERGGYQKSLSLTLREFYAPFIETIAQQVSASPEQVAAHLTKQPGQSQILHWKTKSGEYDMQALFKDTLLQKQEMIAAHLSTQIKTNPEQVLVCGGLAEALFPALQLKWPQAILLSDPLFANAVGSLQYALRHKNCS
ncbi:MAG: ParM/StbA family protein [Acidobacteria bacterium]|nr:ParM/StbA family protein [Acidobacteriota bacterium]